jgi:hypothetical protein
LYLYHNKVGDFEMARLLAIIFEIDGTAKSVGNGD